MFRDRQDAGRRLAATLASSGTFGGALVLGLPRGGAVVAFEIAALLKLPLDVLIVKKIGFPGQPELAIGAVSERGTTALNRDIITMHGLSMRYVDAEIERQKEEISRRVGLYRGGRVIGGLEGRAVILVDDGVATGATMKAAVATLRLEKLQKLVIALPVSPPDTAAELRRMADRFFCLETPRAFTAVGSYYRDFPQTTDSEVMDLLHQAAQKAA
jgi:putative phosphoribosyl transferase